MTISPERTPRVVHITSAHPPYDTRIFLKMCRSLANKGYDTHLVAPRKDRRDVEMRDGVTIHPIRVLENRVLRMTFMAKNAAKVAIGLKGDLYHFHDPELLRFALGIQKATNAPIIYDAHEDIRLQILEKEWLPKGSHKLISTMFGFYEDKISKRLSAVISATPSISQRFQSNPRSAIVQNFPMADELYTTNKATSGAYHRFVYAGIITKQRGIMHMINALAISKNNARLALAGEWCSPEVHEEAAGSPGWKHVEEAGFVDRKTLGELMSTSVGGLVLFEPHPNHINAQPNKLFEYMSAGIPVIASDFPLWREIVGGAECGLLVDPQRPDKIAEAMDYLLNHRDEARKMGERGREAVLNRYNWALEEKVLLELYSFLLTDNHVRDSRHHR